MNEKTINIIGAGLAGCEAAWQVAERGVKVRLYEMKPLKMSPAHKSLNFAELVCSNSFRSDDSEASAVGCLHQELRLMGSLIMRCADETKVPAGGALAVDRDGFSALVSQKIRQHPNIEVIEEEILALPEEDSGQTIIATGPLTSEVLAQDILQKIGGETLSFYDAIAPVIYKESIDFSKAWYQSRYDKGDKFDYINCPMSKEEYYAFVGELVRASRAEFHEFEIIDYENNPSPVLLPNKFGQNLPILATLDEPVGFEQRFFKACSHQLSFLPKGAREITTFFEGCLPVEVMAERGVETLAFGPMKPIGLTNPHAAEKPYAVVQLRQDNKEDTLRNMVGFQTKLKYGEQKRIFSMIPGLEKAEFARLGGIHKNTFIKSPLLLDPFLRLKTHPWVSFAGQITGCEGYVESTAIGFLAGYFAAATDPVLPPKTTAVGAMHAHLTDDTNVEDYQPMNINFGLFPTISVERTASGKLRKIKGAERKKAYCTRALTDILPWLEAL